MQSNKYLKILICPWWQYILITGKVNQHLFNVCSGKSYCTTVFSAVFIAGFWVFVKFLRNKVKFLNAYAFSELIVYSQSDFCLLYTVHKCYKECNYFLKKKSILFDYQLIHHLCVSFSFTKIWVTYAFNWSFVCSYQYCTYWINKLF